MVASLFQMAIGWFGLIGILLRFIGPLTTASTISLVGLTLFKTSGVYCGKHWWIAML